MGTGLEVLGSGLSTGEGGCRLVFTDAVLQNPIPKIYVVFTNIDDTSRALESAALWADRLNFDIDLLVPWVVPYPLPPSNPTASIEFILNEIRRTTACNDVSAEAHVYLCRDRLQILTEVLPAHSVVIIGGKRTWWPSASVRLARKLRSHGHIAVLAK
jgi:hypothetical protein